MIKIAFCYNQDSTLRSIQQEITTNLSRRGIDIQALPAKNADDISYFATQHIYPDIILFSDSVFSRQLLHTFLFLKEQKHSIIFILTKYSETINTSIEVDYHFLLQPFYITSLSSPQELWSCVCKACDLSISDKNSFAYYHRPIYHSTPLNRILYFASEGRCIQLVTKLDSDSFYGRLDDIEDSLAMKNCRFIRIHQSYLVNEQYISSYDRKTVLLTTGKILPISKCEYYHALRRKLSITPSHLSKKKGIKKVIHA